ncbi:CHAT domain-containing protein [Mycena leptocephala]|nr:CHAT domain-containing protein [Mycena leptocephala]
MRPPVHAPDIGSTHFHANYFQARGGLQVQSVAEKVAFILRFSVDIRSFEIEVVWTLANKNAREYFACGRSEDLHRAVGRFQILLDQLKENDLFRGDLLENLAILQFYRYQSSGQLEDLDDAVKHAETAVICTPTRSARRLGIWAVILTSRYQRLSESQNIESAMAYAEEALTATLEDHPERCASLQTVAWVHRGRYEVTGELSALDSAIDHYRQASSLAPTNGGQSYRRCVQDCLCRSVIDTSGNGGKLDDLQHAIKTITDAVKAMHAGNPHLPECSQNLALYLADRYKELKESSDLEDAFRYYSDSFKRIAIHPAHSFEAAVHCASLAQAHKRSDCPNIYSTAFDLLPEILWVGNSLHAHLKTCQRIDITKATSDAFKACVDYSHLKRAVEQVEQGLATALQQSMRLKTKTCDPLSRKEEQELERLSFLIYNGDTSYEDRQKAATERDKLIASIREKPNLKHFLRPTPYSRIGEASKNGPVVILNSHHIRCDAIILLRPTQDPIHIALGDIYNQIVERRKVFKDLVGGRRFIKEGRSGDPEQDFATLLDCLWKDVVAPIYKILKKRGFGKGTRLWWCPTGMFQGLPLHAASNSTWFIQSYTLTLGSLLVTRPRRKPDLNWAMGVVGVTETGPNEGKLKHVETEVRNIERIVKHNQVLLHKEATAEAVKRLLETYSWIHLACHGEQNKEDPRSSCLKLYQDTLNLDTILHLRLSHAEFMFLAACETVKGDDTVTNELTGKIITER